MLQSQEGNSNSIRNRKVDRAREVSNGLYIFEYSPDKVKSKKEDDRNHVHSKAQKSAAYYLKMQELKDKRKQLQGSGVGSDFKSNIDRLRSLIKNGRSQSKQSDSGIEKMMRALQKLIKTSNNIRTTFEALKRYSMAASSNNMELFIQSRHLNLNDTVKISRGKQDKLMPINEHTDETAMNAQSFNYFKEISKHLMLPQQEIDDNKERDRQGSFSFRNMDTPVKQNREGKYISRGYITTRQDLSLSAQNQHSPMGRVSVEAQPKDLVQSRIKLNAPKLGFYGGFIQSSFKQINISPQKLSEPLKVDEPDSRVAQNIQGYSTSQSDEIQLLFSQVAFIFTKKLNQHNEKKSSKPTSPIYSLFAFPTTNSPSEEYHPTKEPNEQPSNHLNPSQKKINSSRRISNGFRKSSRRDELASNAEYANRMLFGNSQKEGGQKGEQQSKKSTRNTLMQQPNLRSRIRSLPKITFTYTSRQKYERECSPEMKNSIFPITIYQKRRLEQSTKDSNRQKQTTISSKKTTTRTNPRFGSTQENQDYNMKGVRSPRFQKIMVDTRHQDQYSVASSFQAGPQEMSNEYYGAYANLRRFDQQRERVITANPGMAQGVQFGAAQRDNPCCCMGKQIRSKSLNDRVVLFNYQNQYQN